MGCNDGLDIHIAWRKNNERIKKTLPIRMLSKTTKLGTRYNGLSFVKFWVNPYHPNSWNLQEESWDSQLNN